jgi:uncharacterized membrane protein YbhN (UPF0104 family)
MEIEEISSPEADAKGKTLAGWPGRMLRTYGPWLGAIGVLVDLVQEVPLEEAWLAARSARLDLFFPEIVAAILVWFLLDSRALAYLLTRFNAPVSWPEARSMRGVTYLLTVLNWNVGTAAIILYLRRAKRVPALEATGSMFFYGNCDGLIMTTLALVGALALENSPAVETIRKAALGFMAFQALTLLAIVSSRPDWRWLQKIRGAAIVRSYRLAVPKDFLFVLGIKLAYFIVFIWIFWAGSHAFGIQIPFALALASAPAVMLVAALPIAPAGLGTQAAAMVFFWSDYGSKAEILAFGLVFPVALVVGRCLLGLLYLGDLKTLRSPVETGEN